MDWEIESFAPPGVLDAGFTTLTVELWRARRLPSGGSQRAGHPIPSRVQ